MRLSEQKISIKYIMISRHILAFKVKDSELQCYLEKNNNMSLRMTIKSKCLVPRTRGLHERTEGVFCLQEDPGTMSVRA